MNDILSENVRDLHSRVIETGNAIGERVQNATAATAIAAGQAQKLVQDATETTAAGVEQAKTMLDDAGHAAQQAWSQAGEIAEDAVDAGRRATRSVSRQIHDNPLMAVLVGSAVAFIAGLWFRGGGPNAKAPSPRRSRAATPPKKAAL
jgi:ElaB/YqjD/DUF883 family membrane-anchored ribosome-binding protein